MHQLRIQVHDNFNAIGAPNLKRGLSVPEIQGFTTQNAALKKSDYRSDPGRASIPNWKTFPYREKFAIRTYCGRPQNCQSVTTRLDLAIGVADTDTD
ncbi:MAG: hypothetical protein ACI814_003049 [Mariniblastus sp.]|jgi:hypothetical protein